MRLKVKGEDIDLRDQLGHERRVIDEDTGKSVGVIVSRQDGTPAENTAEKQRVRGIGFVLPKISFDCRLN